MNRIRKKIRTLLSIDPEWAYGFLKKRGKHHVKFYWSRLLGRKYWDVTIDGVTLHFVFFTPYHQNIAQKFHDGEFEKSALLAWMDRAKTSALIYDIGGYNGIFGLLAAKVNQNSTVIIFEPDEINARHIGENIKVNGLNNCPLEEAAISDENGEAMFTQNGSTGSRFAEWGKKVKVQKLDSRKPANLIKIDIAGAEAKAIAGGLEAFRKTKPIILLEVHEWLAKDEERRMWDSLRELGYKWSQVGDAREGNPHYLVS
jgi:FkbM family methyltransferase